MTVDNPNIPDDADARVAAMLAHHAAPQACESDKPIDPERILSICAEYLPRLTAEHRAARGRAKARLAGRIKSLHVLRDWVAGRNAVAKTLLYGKSPLA